MADIEYKEILSDLFIKEYGTSPEIKLLSGGGSPRRYYRLTSGDVSAVGVIGQDAYENDVFLRLDRVLEKSGLNVPHIIIVSDDGICYLLEDLGDVSLFELLKGDNKMELAKGALETLIKIQDIPESEWAEAVGYAPFSERLVRWDLNYFKYDFLKPAGILFDEEKLEDDFDRMVKLLTSDEMIEGLMYRDFQSRNIMVKDDKLWLIDFQGARKGPVVYDAVSFIWQAKAPFSFEERRELSEFYIKRLEERGHGQNIIKKQFGLLLVFRTLQVLGAYGFRGLIEKKAHFLESIPYAIANLEYLRNNTFLAGFPELERISAKLSLQDFGFEKEENGVLHLKVVSFSYKKGYPEDRSGNGGGFMFDCRAIHNPGRYEEFKDKTGKDREVIEFLEKGGEAEDFVEDAVKLVVPSIERYLKRGFTSLQVGFGCTGGQHRSVYCAERFAKEISGLFPQVKVELEHREQK